MDANAKSSYFAPERKQQILKILQQNQKIVVPELCNYFGVSASTIRNDLRTLQEEGLITRTHGGAISNTKMSLEPLPAEKETKMLPEKTAIAKAASALVDDKDIIALCTGTTTQVLAHHLLGKKDLTVVINDIRIASYLEENSDFNLFMLGGVIRKGFHYVNTAGHALPNINVDKVFFSCNGLSPGGGATVPDFQLANNISQLISRASEAILLCDSSKVGTAAFAQILPIEKIDRIVTDSGISETDLAELQEMGTNIQVCDTENQ